MKYVKQFIKTSGVFFVGNTLTKLISFFLLPLYTLKIAPDSFGYYDLTISILSLLIPILFFQAWDGIFRFTFDYEGKSEKYMVISNGLIIQLFGLIIYAVTFLVVINTINYHIEFKYLIFIYGVLYAFQYYYNCVARSFSKNGILVAAGLINTIISLILNVVLITVFDLGIEALYISYIIGTLIQLAMLETNLKVISNFNINVVSTFLIRKVVYFSLPLCVITVSYWLLSGLTRLAISYELGMYENGLFGIANRLSSIIILVVNVFQFAWYEMSYSMNKEEGKKKYYQYSLNYILKVILYVGSLSLVLIKVLFPHLIAQDYHEALVIIPITFIGVLINSYVSFSSTLFLAEKDSNKLLMPILVSSVVNILGLFLFTNTYGLVGATLTLTLSFLVSALIITFKLKRQYRITIGKKTLVKGLFVFLMSIVVFYKVDEALYLVIIFLFFLMLLVYAFKDTMTLIIRFLKKRKII